MNNIIDFGAVNDGVTISTSAIQKAVDKCRDENGGVVYIPFGSYVVTSVHLCDNVHFVFEPGAQLLGSLNPDDFDAREKPEYPLYQDASHSYFRRSMFWAENCKNISFTGAGVINMRSVWENTPVEGEVAWSEKRANKIFALKNCKDIVISDLSLQKSTDLAVYLAGCERVRITGLMMDVHIDAISPDCCKDVVISDCVIRCGDDGIVLKSSYTLNEKKLCENIVVSNCTITSRCSAIKLGTESNGEFKNIAITNCAIYETSLGGLSFEITDGGEIDGITASNIVMKNVGYPLFIILSDRGRGPEGTKLGTVKNIIVNNLTANGPYVPWIAPQLTTLYEGEKPFDRKVTPSTVTGQPDRKIENITLSNIFITVPGGGTEEDKKAILPEITHDYPENYQFGKSFPAYGIYFRHVKNLTMTNVHVETLDEDKRNAFVFDDVENLKIQ